MVRFVWNDDDDDHSISDDEELLEDDHNQCHYNDNNIHHNQNMLNNAKFCENDDDRERRFNDTTNTCRTLTTWRKRRRSETEEPEHYYYDHDRINNTHLQHYQQQQQHEEELVTEGPSSSISLFQQLQRRNNSNDYHHHDDEHENDINGDEIRSSYDENHYHHYDTTNVGQHMQQEQHHQYWPDHVEKRGSSSSSNICTRLIYHLILKPVLVILIAWLIKKHPSCDFYLEHYIVYHGRIFLEDVHEMFYNIHDHLSDLYYDSMTKQQQTRTINSSSSSILPIPSLYNCHETFIKQNEKDILSDTATLHDDHIRSSSSTNYDAAQTWLEHFVVGQRDAIQDCLDSLLRWEASITTTSMSSNEVFVAPHWLVLAGPHGIGKHELAQRMAQLVLFGFEGCSERTANTENGVDLDGVGTVDTLKDHVHSGRSSTYEDNWMNHVFVLDGAATTANTNSDAAGEDGSTPLNILSKIIHFIQQSDRHRTKWNRTRRNNKRTNKGQVSSPSVVLPMVRQVLILKHMEQVPVEVLEVLMKACTSTPTAATTNGDEAFRLSYYDTRKRRTISVSLANTLIIFTTDIGSNHIFRSIMSSLKTTNHNNDDDVDDHNHHLKKHLNSQQRKELIRKVYQPVEAHFSQSLVLKQQQQTSSTPLTTMSVVPMIPLTPTHLEQIFKLRIQELSQLHKGMLWDSFCMTKETRTQFITDHSSSIDFIDLSPATTTRTQNDHYVNDDGHDGTDDINNQSYVFAKHGAHTLLERPFSFFTLTVLRHVKEFHRQQEQRMNDDTTEASLATFYVTYEDSFYILYAQQKQFLKSSLEEVSSSSSSTCSKSSLMTEDELCDGLVSNVCSNTKAETSEFSGSDAFSVVLVAKWH